jgi:hypothetical protein
LPVLDATTMGWKNREWHAWVSVFIVEVTTTTRVPARPLGRVSAEA